MPDQLQSWQTLLRRASQARRDGDHSLAVRLYSEAISAGRSGGCPVDQLAILLNSLSNAYRLQGRLDDALRVAREAVEFGKSSLPARSALQANALMFLARIHDERGESPDAANAATEGVAAYEQTYGPEHPEVTAMRHTLDDILTRLSSSPKS
jgi:hypothetical protein